MTVVFAIIVFLAAYGVGGACCRLAGCDERLRAILGPIFLPVLRFSVGSGMMALMALFLSAAQIVSPVLLNVLNLSFAVVGSILMWQTRQDFRLRNFRWKRPSDLVGFVLLAMAAALYVKLTWNPLLLIDSWAYHITIPKQYLIYGGVFYTPYELHPNLHFLSDFFLMWGLALDQNDFILAKAPQVVALFGTALVIMSYLRRHGYYTLGWFACLMYLLHDEAIEFAPSAHVDLSLANYLVVGLLVLLTTVKAGAKELPRLLILAGMLFGFAVGTKTSGLLLTVIIGGVALLFIFAAHWRSYSPMKYIILTGFFGVTCALVASPWIIKNIIITGSPLYPFLIDTFPPNDEFSQVALDFHRIYGNFAGYSLLDLDFYISFFQQLDRHFRNTVLVDQSAWIGVFLLGTLGYYYKTKPRLNARNQIFVTAAILFPLVVLTPARRFVTGPAAILFFAGLIGAVVIVPRVRMKDPKFKLAMGLIALLLIARQADRQWGRIHPHYVPRGTIPAGMFLTSDAQRTGYLNSHDKLNLANRIEEQVGPDGRILVTKIDAVLAALNVPTLPLLNIHGKKIHQLMMDAGSSEDDVRAKLRELGITHVLVYDEIRTVDSPNLFLNWDE